MNKYINADELRTEFWTPDDKEYSYGDICKILDEMTSADAVEVKHGEWLNSYRILEFPFECSVCHKVAYEESNYCPNCGADMRGRKERNEEDN